MNEQCYIWLMSLSPVSCIQQSPFKKEADPHVYVYVFTTMARPNHMKTQ